jgi:hypothetical protein
MLYTYVVLFENVEWSLGLGIIARLLNVGGEAVLLNLLDVHEW